jgi:PTS system nitrogen regulatory IIA component
VQREISSAKKLLQEMSKLLSIPLHKIEEDNVEKNIYHALLEREKIGNTGIGNGVALPHSRFVDTNQAVIALITLSNAIDYDSPDHQPVDIAFGLIVPQQATQEHLNLLAEIARLMSHADNKQKLSLATTPDQVMELITSWSEN